MKSLTPILSHLCVLAVCIRLHCFVRRFRRCASRGSVSVGGGSGRRGASGRTCRSEVSTSVPACSWSAMRSRPIMAGDGFFGDREQAAEAAAFVGPLEFGEFDAVERRQQLPRLVERRADQFAVGGECAARADRGSFGAGRRGGGSGRRGGRPSSTSVRNSHSSNVLWATAWSAVGRAEDLFVVVADHRDATAGRGDDVIVVAEDLEESFGQRAGVGVQADVGHRLAAAGLLFGKLDLAAEALQHLDRGQADLRIELVDVAGDEEADAHGVFAAGCCFQCRHPGGGTQAAQFR